MPSGIRRGGQARDSLSESAPVLPCDTFLDRHGLVRTSGTGPTTGFFAPNRKLAPSVLNVTTASLRGIWPAISLRQNRIFRHNPFRPNGFGRLVRIVPTVSIEPSVMLARPVPVVSVRRVSRGVLNRRAVAILRSLGSARLITHRERGRGDLRDRSSRAGDLRAHLPMSERPERPLRQVSETAGRLPPGECDGAGKSSPWSVDSRPAVSGMFRCARSHWRCHRSTVRHWVVAVCGWNLDV